MEDDTAAAAQEASSSIDTSVPHSARIWNYWLGGKDHYPIDRAAGDDYARAFPGIFTIARESRNFLARSVRYLATEAGVRQFLDVGTGLPTAENTHEVAQRVAPEARIVYVDNDPLVLLHARVLLTSSPEGATDYVHADLRDPASIIDHASRTLDFSKPVALMLMGVLGHVSDYDEAAAIVRALMAPLPSGSYFASSEGTWPEEVTGYVEAQDNYNDSGAIPYVLRTPEQLTHLFDGLELVPPGVVNVTMWRPGPAPDGTPPELVAQHGGIGRKP